MADRDGDKNSKRGLASADKETRERVARRGGEASHRNDDKGSSGGRSGSSGGSSGGERGGSTASREGGSSGGDGRGGRD